uniref:Small ribosomal subunit protein uS5c n=1 Tax=Porphyridium purpureum TaxID=35688 RepID=W0S1T0_PORPP|nr:chloroplast 30S ribosomal protein S5 [Porphyridium purpureum]ATJ02886.1 30S ribosomal protein S5 [Porphyridium purpureum]BAO23663.1 chloroplast 30S ribosomal protein S5 [Porphyridium purpureum]
MYSADNKKKNPRKTKTIKWVEKAVQVRRVTKVVKGGKKLSFRVIVIVGNEFGMIGVGVGKAADVIGAVKKGVTDAKRNLIQVPLTKDKTIPHKIIGIFGAASVMMRPSAPGSGVIAGGAVRTVLELSGIKNILAKQLRSSNPLNNARATLNGLTRLKTIKEVAQDRNLPLEALYN